MTGMSRANGSAARPHHRLMIAAAIAGGRLLLYLGSLAVLVGGGVGIAFLSHARGSDRPFWFWFLLWLFVATATLSYDPDPFWLDPHPALCRVFCGLAIVAGLAFTWGLGRALDEQTLLDRGVVETAVVTAEHPWHSLVTGTTDYSYTLTDAHGREIPHDIAISEGRLREGGQVTVLVDPEGEIGPSLALHPSPRGEWIVARVGFAIAVISLAGLAVTAPRPAFGSL